MEPMKLPGLERLIEVCRRLSLPVITTPPSCTPPPEGAMVGGHPFDPVLAAVYSRLGRALFNDDIYLLRVQDDVNELERESQWWRESWQEQLALPLFVFGGKVALAYYLATVPGLADARGRQPVVEVDTYELDGPYALPLASDADRFFDTYSRYLEAVVNHPDYEEPGDTPLVFPWEVPELLARDAPLVELLRAGRFDPLMPKNDEVRDWVSKVLHAAT